MASQDFGRARLKPAGAKKPTPNDSSIVEKKRRRTKSVIVFLWVCLR